MFNIMLTQSNNFIIGPIAAFFGVLMDAIYGIFSNSFGIQSLGLSIIVFTIITRLFMLPLAFKQQKSMQEMQRIQPELKKIQEKYKDKKDPSSQKQMQMEQSKLFHDHNINPMAGCLPLLIQMPIIFALFNVLRNIPAYIMSIKDIYIQIIEKISISPAYEEVVTSLAANGSFDITNQNKVIDTLYTVGQSGWDNLIEQLGNIDQTIYPLIDKLNEINNFFGINLAEIPKLLSIGILIPILTVVFTFLQSKYMNIKNNGEKSSQQATMMYTMPLFMGFIVTTMPAGLGLYWIVSTMIQVIQQVVINRHLSREMN